jgi:hypothetical protein
MWARVPLDVKATAIAVVLIGFLMVPIHSSGWTFPGFSALASTVHFYRGLNLAEDGQVDEALDSFRRSLHLPVSTAKPAVELGPPLQPARTITWPHHTEPCDSMKRLVVEQPKSTADCL